MSSWWLLALRRTVRRLELENYTLRDVTRQYQFELRRYRKLAAVWRRFEGELHDRMVKTFGEL